MSCPPGSRGVLAAHAQRYLNEVESGARPGSEWHQHVEASLWGELATPCAEALLGIGDRDPEPEARSFWAELEPAAQEAVIVCLQARDIAQLGAETRRAEFAEVARRCCVVQLEPRFLRGYAVAAKLLPDLGVDYLHVSCAERMALLESCPDETVCLQDAFHGACRWTARCERHSWAAVPRSRGGPAHS